jgi:predicted HTH domain antitoxin
LAIALYTQHLLSSGKACALAGLTRAEWETTLGKRQVPRHYSDADLAEDLGYGQRGG